ncbi:hypothetical protein D3C78_1634660 [compost metagenome]
MRLLQQVDAAQEGRLARTAGADDADDIACLGRQGHALEHFMAAVALVQVLDFEFVHAVDSHKAVSACAAPGSRASGVRPS